MSEQRDLRADLEGLQKNQSEWSELPKKIIVEYIERAIKAEEELEKQQQLFTAQTDRNVEIIKRLNERKREVCEANDLLSAQAAAYRKVIIDCPIEAQDGCNCPDCKAVRNCENILYTQPDPGADLLAKMEKLEAVAEAAKPIGICPNCDNNCRYCPIIDLQQALAALEGDSEGK